MAQLPETGKKGPDTASVPLVVRSSKRGPGGGGQKRKYDEDTTEDVKSKRVKGHLDSEEEGPKSDGKSTEVAEAKAVAGPSAPGKTAKRFIDLTGKPPPGKWLKAHAKGVHLPRELTIHSTANFNVLFYDYDPKFVEDDGTKMQQKVHDGNSFKWWKDPKQIQLDALDFE